MLTSLLGNGWWSQPLLLQHFFQVCLFTYSFFSFYWCIAFMTQGSDRVTACTSLKSTRFCPWLSPRVHLRWARTNFPEQCLCKSKQHSILLACTKGPFLPFSTLSLDRSFVCGLQCAVFKQRRGTGLLKGVAMGWRYILQAIAPLMIS